MTFVAILDRDFFQRFQAIDRKARTDDLHPLDPVFCHGLQSLVGIRLEPFGPAQARLKRDRPGAVGQFEALGNLPGAGLAIGSSRGRRPSGCASVYREKKTSTDRADRRLFLVVRDLIGDGIQPVGLVAVVVDETHFRQTTAVGLSERVTPSNTDAVVVAEYWGLHG